MMLVQLLEAALRSFALGGAVWLSLRFLRVHNPQARMTAWTLVLMASLSMPVVMHWATVTIPTYSSPPDVAIAPVSPPTITPATFQPAESLTAKISRPPAAENDSIGAHPHEASSVDPSLAAIDWRSLAMGLYLAVAVGFLLRLAIGVALTWRLLRKGQPITEDWTSGSDVRLSGAVATPVTVGRTILLPAECRDWSPIKCRAVLAHERSHVVGGDFHVLLLATLHRAVFWFSPFSWWLLNELAETAELISDDAAIEILGDRPCYAEILLDVAGSARSISAGIAMARTRSAVKRVEHILAVDAPPPPRLGWARRALIAMSLAPLVSAATVSFSKETKLVNVTFPALEHSLTDQPPGKLLAAAAAAPQLWISWVAGSAPAADSGWLFSPDADWKTVASHTSAIQLPPAVILNNKEDVLKRAFENLAERHIGLALEFRVLVRTDQCSQWTKAFSDPGDLEKILDRIHRLGGDLKYAVMDDPFFFGHRFSAGSAACLELPARLAQQIAEKIRLVRTYFPDAEIGTADVVDESRAWIDELAEWTDVYQKATGEPLAFFHADVAWSHAAIRNLAPLAQALKARHIPFGIIYNADDAAHSDETWIDSTRQHIAEIESSLGIRPYAAIFRSWAPYPSRLLPEPRPGTLTNLAFQYLLARPSVTLTREANVLSGRMLDGQGRPVASANLTVDALDVAGSMDLVERHLTGKVPQNSSTAMVVMQVNMEEACVCAGRVDASFGTFRYHEVGSGRHEEIPPFPASAGNALPSVRVMQFPPAQSVFLAFKSFPVTPGADYEFDVPLSVSANGERAGYAAVVFLDGAGKWVKLDRLWFRPSVRNLGNPITNADGRFQLEIPEPVVEARSDIRAYFPGSASLGSQTVTVSQ
jgi:beta-lactamase regulating signal transducer with metallopeptidase domain